tara:strand:- start:313 stop:468 length:156 start_codon:yes stop_codon:yes gene_type:complete
MPTITAAALGGVTAAAAVPRVYLGMAVLEFLIWPQITLPPLGKRVAVLVVV